VGRRPCKGPQVDTKILKENLKKTYMNSELLNIIVSLYQNAQKISRKNLTCVVRQRFWVRPRGAARKIFLEGPQSH